MARLLADAAGEQDTANEADRTCHNDAQFLVEPGGTDTDAAVNGALVALGAAVLLDNVFSHWLLGLHRAVPGGWALPVEIALAVLGAVMIGVGVRREVGARGRNQARGRP